MSQQRDTKTYHTPVLVEEVLEWLAVGASGRFVDGTAGGGGHTEAILEASAPDGQVLAVDRDPEAVEQIAGRLEHYQSRLQVVRANYSQTPQLLERIGWEPVDGWLIDAGVSSHQLETPERGFSFSRRGPLDMRMGPDALSVAEFLDDIDTGRLAEVLREYGELSDSRRLASAIMEAHRAGELETTTDLAELAEQLRGGPEWKTPSIHPATLVFQALRIAVNRELEHLRGAVEAIPEVVAEGGRAVFISFHSLEDRIVKHGFRRLADPCVCPPDFPRCGCAAEPFGTVLTKRPVTAGEAEIEENPRARSAKLRAFAVTGEGRWPD